MDAADTATFRKAPIRGAPLRNDPHRRGRCHVDPAIARDLDISFDLPGTSHPLREELGISRGRFLVFVRLTDPFGYLGYTFEIVGTDPPPTLADTAPTFRFPNLAMLELIVAYQRRVTHIETSIYLEKCWHPEQGETDHLSWPSVIPRKTINSYEATARKLLQKVEARGRRKGPTGFRDIQEFEDTVADLIRIADRKGQTPTQLHIARLLRPVLVERTAATYSAASLTIDDASTVRLMRKHLSMSWPALVNKTRQSH
jgi:hypothetical protein